MNTFNAQAREAGRIFAQTNPQATGVQIDDASPKFNPARRHFQEAAYAELRMDQATRLLSTYNTLGHTVMWQREVKQWLGS